MLLAMYIVFFFNDTATTEIYTLSLHDALPISSAIWRLVRPPATRAATSRSRGLRPRSSPDGARGLAEVVREWCASTDRKSTRLNSSHANISYAVFCLKKKKTHHYILLLLHNQ